VLLIAAPLLMAQTERAAPRGEAGRVQVEAVGQPAPPNPPPARPGDPPPPVAPPTSEAPPPAPSSPPLPVQSTVRTARSQETPSKPVHFEAAVFELELGADKIAALDMPELIRQSATPAACEQALRKLGAVRTLYRVDQSVSSVSERELRISSDVPYLGVRPERPRPAGALETRKTADGPEPGVPDAALLRQNAGVEFEITPLSPPPAPAEPTRLRVSADISAMGASSVRAAGDTTAPVFRHVRQAWQGSTANSAPALLLSLTGAEGRESAVAYITWLRVSEAR
jgi:hypothetical protein